MALNDSGYEGKVDNRIFDSIENSTLGLSLKIELRFVVVGSGTESRTARHAIYFQSPP